MSVQPPVVNVQDIQDPVVRRNFQNLIQWFKDYVLDGVSSSSSVAGTASAATASSGSWYTGELRHVPFAKAPDGWLMYTEAPLKQSSYPALYAIFAKTYAQNGDAADTFRLPKLFGRTIIAAGAGSGLTSRAMGDSGGEEGHVLSTAEMPSHTHTDSGHSHTIPTYGNIPAIANNLATSSDVFRNNTGGPTNTGAANIQNTGGGGAHNNMQPFSAWYVMIKT